MIADLKFLDSVRSAGDMFFKKQVVIRRSGRGMQIVFQDHDTPAAAPTQQEVLARRAAAELALMRAQLAALLDEEPETRLRMRHLVFVEQSIAGQGLRALQQVPLEVVQKALQQFESLVVNWSPIGLASLRSKMAVAIRERLRSGGDTDDVRRRERDEGSQMRDSTQLPSVEVCSDEEALAAVYGALAAPPPTTPPHNGA